MFSFNIVYRGKRQFAVKSQLVALVLYIIGVFSPIWVYRIEHLLLDHPYSTLFHSLVVLFIELIMVENRESRIISHCLQLTESTKFCPSVVKSTSPLASPSFSHLFFYYLFPFFNIMLHPSVPFFLICCFHPLMESVQVSHQEIHEI